MCELVETMAEKRGDQLSAMQHVTAALCERAVCGATRMLKRRFLELADEEPTVPARLVGLEWVPVVRKPPWWRRLIRSLRH